MGCFQSILSKEVDDNFSNVAPEAKDLGADHKVNLVMKQKRDAKRRGDVFAESVALETNIDPVFVPKSNAAKKLIHNALRRNFLFASIHSDEINEMVNVMSSKKVDEGQVLIRQGDHGDFFYVVETGTYDIQVDDAVVGNVGPASSFGELALLYDSPRAATITAKTTGQLWVLNRVSFRNIVARNMAEQLDGCKTVLRSVPLLESLMDDQLDKLAEAIQLVNFDDGERIITKGEPGNVFYIVKSGTVVCSDTGEHLEDLALGEGDYFGERALMTNEPRAANVTASSKVVAMALDREAFDELLGPLRDVIDRNIGIRVLQSVPILTALSPGERTRLFEAFDTLTFKAGESVIVEGEKGTTFYIVKSGTLSVMKKQDGEDGYGTKVASLASGEYFGEMALLEEEPRKASVIALSDVALFALDQEKFEKLLGPLQDIMNREAKDRKLKMAYELRYDFSDLEIITTLGTGTFGRVKLVRHKKGQQVYALKIMQKAQVVAYKQKANVLHEKNIMAMCDHPNILKLHQTFKDSKNLYLLMELVQGGELFTYLHNSTTRKTDYIPDDHARFYAANVLMALEYLHARDIVYRDLKPENLLIDLSGYIKVADFGFAKIVTNRTYTLCGTPEYLAPELVLGKGHNKGVDYWALGVLIYEMVVGHSPFAASCANDQMQICRNIVNGNISYPQWVSANCRSLIEKFLTKDTTKRLGEKHGGSRLVRTQPWFANTNWDRLFNRKESAPWIPTISGELDTSNFDPYEEEEIYMDYRDDGSGWDKDF